MSALLSSLRPSSLAVLMLLPVVAPAQTSRNVALRGRFEATTFRGYNDIWGYVAPDGREYALLGAVNGTYVLDATDKPALRGFFAGTLSTWRDIKTFGSHAYIVNDRGPGVQILDLSDPDKPKLAATRFTSGAWRNAHNIGMDFARGHAYVHGTNNGLYILDVKANATSPPLLRRIRGNYIHDLSVQNGLLHAAEITAGRYAIYDVRNLDKRPLGSIATPSNATHNTWPSYDDRFCVTTDERSGGSVALYDITNRNQPKLVSTYRSGSSATIPHNAYIRDRLIYVAHYVEGLRVVDMSDPNNLVEVGYYDTFQEGLFGGFIGAWGCFCFNPSGKVYISDTRGGLFVLEPRAATRAYGKATPASTEPSAHPFGSAYLGNRHFRLGVRDALANAPAFLVLGAKPADVDIGGLRLLVDLVNAPSLLVPVATDASGEAFVPFPVPSDPGLDGVELHAQFLVVDGRGPNGLAATRGMRFELFRR